MWWFWVRSAWLQVFSLTFVVLQSGKSRSRGFTPAPCGSPIKCLKMHMRTPTALSSKLWQSRWLLRWGCSTATACRKHTHTLCGKVFCIVLFFLNSVILLWFSAQNHLFQKSTVGQMLRWFHCPGFQVSEWSCNYKMFSFLLLHIEASQRWNCHVTSVLVSISRLSVKVALLLTTCPSS